MREKEFTCPEKVSAKAKQNEKISILYNTKVLEVRGDEEMIKSITYCNDLTGEKTTFAPDNERFGVFIFAGYEPATEFVRDIIKLNDKDYIVTDCAKRQVLTVCMRQVTYAKKSPSGCNGSGGRRYCLNGDGEIYFRNQKT